MKCPEIIKEAMFKEASTWDYVGKDKTGRYIFNSGGRLKAMLTETSPAIKVWKSGKANWINQKYPTE